MIRSSEYDKLELKHQNLDFTSLSNALLKKCHGVKQKKKYVPLVKQNVMKFEVFYLGGQRRERRDGGEGVERGLRKGAERG